ncbi:MAG: PAS domain-containing sensor histidine kinase [Steroidobacteraceae bacterium]
MRPPGGAGRPNPGEPRRARRTPSRGTFPPPWSPSTATDGWWSPPRSRPRCWARPSATCSAGARRRARGPDHPPPALGPRPRARRRRARRYRSRARPGFAAIEVDAEAIEASFATELAAHDRRQAKLLGHIDDTISIVDENGEIRGGTGDVKGLLGYAPGYLSEHSIFDLVAPDEVDRAWETMHRILSSPGEEIRGEFHIQAADGSWAEIEVIAVNLLHDPDVRGGIVTTRNVTVRNNQARELARARDDALRQARFRGEFVASVSHELRTPLHALLGLTELLLADPDLGETAHTMAAAAHGQGENLRRLVDDLLDLSRIESGRLVLERVPFDPVQVVREVCAALAPRAAEHDLELHVHVPDPPRAGDRRAGAGAAGARRPRSLPPGDHQPRGQRGQVHRCRVDRRHRGPRPRCSRAACRCAWPTPASA